MGNPPLASCAKAYSIQNLFTCPQLSGPVSSFIPSYPVHLGLFTPWSIRLRSAVRGLLFVPLMCSATAHSRSFVVWAPVAETIFFKNCALSSSLTLFPFSERPEEYILFDSAALTGVGSASEFLNGAI